MNYFCIELEGYMLIQILMCARPCDLFRTSFCSINIDKFLLLSVFQLDIVTLREREERATEQKEKKMFGSDIVCILCLNNILLLALSQMNMYDGQSTHHYQHRSHLR
jgi:hypothetical protein